MALLEEILHPQRTVLCFKTNNPISFHKQTKHQNQIQIRRNCCSDFAYSYVFNVHTLKRPTVLKARSRKRHHICYLLISKRKLKRFTRMDVCSFCMHCHKMFIRFLLYRGVARNFSRGVFNFFLYGRKVLEDFFSKTPSKLKKFSIEGGGGRSPWLPCYFIIFEKMEMKK